MRLTKKQFNSSMNRLAKARNEFIDAERMKIYWDKLSCQGWDDEMFRQIIEIALEEKYFPTIGRLIEIGRDVKINRTKDVSNNLIRFECGCGEPFSARKTDLEIGEGHWHCKKCSKRYEFRELNEIRLRMKSDFIQLP